MQKLKEKIGFTLMEIIVVLIILGVLVSIGLPSYYNWLERSRTAEAMANLKYYADTLDSCMFAHADQPNPGNYCQSNSDLPNAVRTVANFRYGLDTALGVGRYFFTACYVNSVDPDPPVNMTCSDITVPWLVGNDCVILCKGSDAKRTLVGSGNFKDMY